MCVTAGVCVCDRLAKGEVLLAKGQLISFVLCVIRLPVLVCVCVRRERAREERKRERERERKIARQRDRERQRETER